jgi:MoxR-like ATPase
VSTKLTDKFASLKEALTERHFERYDEIEISMAALLSRHHVVLVGPPGTGKSMLTRDITKAFTGAEYYEHLMTKFTSPDELFGPVSIEGIKAGRYERILDHTAATCHIAFLDEVFKANSAILNSALGLMNERQYKNGTEILQVPLISLFGASNELPEGEELWALFDRFLFRKRVDYIMDPAKFMKMIAAPERVEIPSMRLSDLDAAQKEVREVQATDATLDSIYAIRSDLQQEGVVVSDRRYRQSVTALQALAWQAGRDVILDDDFRVLQHIYWTNPQDVKKVARTVLRHTNPLDLEAADIMEMVDTIAGELSAALLDRKQKGQARDALTQKGIEWFTKCKAMSEDIAKLEKKAKSAGKSTIMIEQTKDRLYRLAKMVSSETMGLEVKEKGK